MTAAAQAEQLLAALWRSWDASTGLEMIRWWHSHVGRPLPGTKYHEGGVEFRTAFPESRLHGVLDVPCLLLGDRKAVARTVDEFLTVENRDKICLILCATDQTVEAARARVKDPRHVVISSEMLATIPASADPQRTLRSFLLRSVPRRSLIPYNYLLTPEPNMFFGRDFELDKLMEDRDTSYAIVGPGKIGKTTLAIEYRRRLLQKGDPRSQACFLVDMQECGHRDADSLAQFLARKIEGTSRSQKVDAGDFCNMLRRVRLQLGRRPEVILDEADEICHKDFLSNVLGEAAKSNLCRLILCGRGRLLRETQSPESQLEGRLAQLRLEPLAQDPAEKLLIEPLSALGFKILDTGAFLAEAFRLTGRLPHLLQIAGKKLAEAGIDSGTEELSLKTLSTIQWDYEFAQVMISPLDRLDDRTRRIALSLVMDAPAKITHSTLQHIAGRLKIALGYDDTRELANELFVHNVLAWSGGSYRIAYEALPHYAREMGLLDESTAKVT